MDIHQKQQMQLMIEQMKKEKLINYSYLNESVIKGQIVFAGSSLCEQFPVNELLNSYAKRHIVYNRGISGDTTSGLMNTLQECIFELSPSKIFINIGSNDLNDPSSSMVLFENYESILLKIMYKLPEATIYILSYYPINNKKKGNTPEVSQMFSGRTNETINLANRRLVTMAEKLGCEYIDVNTILLDEKGDLNAKYTLEGVHLLPNAYVVILDKLAQYF